MDIHAESAEPAEESIWVIEVAILNAEIEWLEIVYQIEFKSFSLRS